MPGQLQPIFDFGEFWTQISSIPVRFGANFGRSRATFADLGQRWSTLLPNWSIPGHSWPPPSQFLPAQCGPTFADAGPNMVEMGRIRLQTTRSRDNFGRFRATLADLGRLCPEFGHTWPEIGRTRFCRPPQRTHAFACEGSPARQERPLRRSRSPEALAPALRRSSLCSLLAVAILFSG